MTIHLNKPDLTELKPKIAVIGVGGAGGNAVNNMIAADLEGVSFIVANTDAQALTHSKADTIIQLGVNITEGLGAGSKPEIGAAAAEESIDEIRSHMAGLHMVFITAGMGGGTGTGAAPVIAAAARAEGVLTVGVVTKPFHFEGQRRMRSADFGIELLSEQVDTLIVIPNQNLFRVAVMKTTFSEAFAMADQVLHDGISCITDVMVKEGIINLDFADVNLVMRGSGKAMMGTGDAVGENRGREAAEAAISNPLLDDISLHGAKGLLVSIIGGHSDLTLYEVDEAANRVREEVAQDANIIVGTAFDESLGGAIRVSVVATGLDENLVSGQQTDEVKAGSTNHQGLPGKPDKSLANRLEDITPGPVKADAALVPAPAPSPEPAIGITGLPGEKQEAQIVPSRTLPEPERQASLAAEPLSATAKSGSPAELDYVDPPLRMPSIDDFSPVGQALLREQYEAVEEGMPSAGIEAHKDRAGFFSRLADLATGGQTKERTRQTVAEQPQVARQMMSEAELSPTPFMDPHVKGGALSGVQVTKGLTPVDVSEGADFPSFLRKNS
ncbi:MAG: cell division protein FtsZ [Hyphomicrobiaceae bacterium]|nr:cell division protein FtsZ [Hyphomicrobiaceae bacterium]